MTAITNAKNLRQYKSIYTWFWSKYWFSNGVLTFLENARICLIISKKLLDVVFVKGNSQWDK